MEYLITPPEPTAWKIGEADLIEPLKNRYSEIEIKPVVNPDDYYTLEWVIQLPEKGTRLDGALHRDGQGISLDGNLEDCAAFAIWFRSLVPQEQKLVFYDQGYNAHVELQENTPKPKIVEPFLTLV